jgi:hypothetical protein
MATRLRLLTLNDNLREPFSEADMDAGFDLGRERRATLLPIALAFPVAIALWLAVAYLVPLPDWIEGVPARLLFALKCVCVAALFCLATGVEAVAHERLVSPAIDPLRGYETRRFRVNQRYLQNTLEQFVLHAAGLCGLAVYVARPGPVLATTVVWIAARAAFWIGYHRGSAQRAYGAPGLALSLIVLLYVCARFGFELAGVVGAVIVIVAFLAIEALLFCATRSDKLPGHEQS